MKEQIEYEEMDEWTFFSVISYIKDNIIQIILFFSIFLIIYIIDYVSNINAILSSTPYPILLDKKKIKKAKNFKK